MMSKDYPFITDEEWQKAMHEDCPHSAVLKILNGKCKKGYTRVLPKDQTTDVFVCNTVGGKDDFDTHHAYVFLREIEPEKVECDHVYRGNVGFANFSIYPEMVPDESMYKFCPLCGEDITSLRKCGKKLK